MSIDNSLKETIKLLKSSVVKMSEQREMYQKEIQRLRDVATHARQRATDLSHEIVALGVTADNADTNVAIMLQDLVKLDEEMRAMQDHLSKI